jgi:hypothetical protein
MAASKKMIIHQMDVDTAFLNAPLEEDIYMIPPDGYDIAPGKVLKLKKSLYGLKQSPRNFNMTLNNTLVQMGFQRCVSDTCIYYQRVNGHDMYISIYVDDIIIACADEPSIINIKAEIMTHYKCKDMGVMDWYLGMRYTRDSITGTVTLDQSKYAEDVVNKFDGYVPKSPLIRTPMETNLQLPKWTEDHDKLLSANSKEFIRKFPYRQVVGSLLYLAIWIRPDITYAVHLVAKHCVHPTLAAIHACRRILGYIRNTLTLGLTFYPGDLRLISFVDSSFSDIGENRKSTAGLIQYLGYSPIYWETFVANTTIPLSTAEAEYVAAHVAGKEIMATNNLLTELQLPQTRVPLYEDNEACIKIALQESSKHKTKHIDNKIHYIRDLIQQGHVDIIYIHTLLQVADIFTKALGNELFLKHRNVLLGAPPTGELAVYLASTKNSYLDQRTTEEIDTLLHYPPNWNSDGFNSSVF